MLLKRRLPPNAREADGGKQSGASHLVLGTLSAVVGHPINGYLPMPGWCNVQLDASVREPPKEEPRALAPASGMGGGNSSGSFYSGSSPESSSEDGSDSDPYDSGSRSGENSESSSENSSVSGSGTESGSDSETNSESESESDSSGNSRSRSNSSESSSSGGSSSESSSSKGEEGVGLLIMGPGASNSAATYGASAPAPHSQDLTGLVERLSVVDREDSASPQFGAPPAGGGLGSLSMAGVRGPGPAQGGLGNTQSSVRSMSVSSDVGADPEGEANVSFPSTLLRHQAGGGLQVDYRFARGRGSSLTRPSTTLTLRLTLTNHKETPIRRIRVVAPRDGTPMEAFPEVQILAAGGTFLTNLGIDFGGKSKEVSFFGEVQISASRSREAIYSIS